MPKRKRGGWQQQQSIGRADSEDEIIVAVPRQTTSYSENSDIEALTDHLHAGVNEITKSKGIITPLTEQDRSDQGQAQEVQTAADSTRTSKIGLDTARILVPDCRDGPAYPRSSYWGFQPPRKELSEREAVSLLTVAHKDEHANDDEQPEYTYFCLDRFSVYRPRTSARHANELVTLDRLSKDSYPEFCFDGILSVGTHRCFVRNVHFATLTVDGYGDPDVNSADMSDQLCVQSVHARKQGVWYKLGLPAPEYARFYRPFLWLVQFTKHFVEYLLCTESVTIAHFRERFYAWLQERQDTSLHAWLREANLRDFRTTVAAHVDFLWKECYGTQQPSDEIKICKQSIWGEIHPARLSAIPEQPNLAKRTVVTPYAYDCFKTMYFADQFVESPIIDLEVRETVQALKAKLGLTPLCQPQVATLTPVSNTPESSLPDSALSAVQPVDAVQPINAVQPIDAATTSAVDIDVGDVVMLPPEKEGSWRSVADCWYAYVQRIRIAKDGRTRLDVIWLYHASDTTIGSAYYPFPNELFFSDNCGCDTRHHQESWDLEEVIGKVDVSWFSCDPYQANEKGLFVRQKFRTVPEMDHFDFVTLRESDFRCHHQLDHTSSEEEEIYEIGDLVIVRNPQEALCEVAQIIGGRSRCLRLRRLRRKRIHRPSARANELVLTSEVFEAAYEKSDGHGLSSDDMDEDEKCQVIRKCHARIFTREEIDTGNVPTPYDRDGAGDFFVIEAGGAEFANADAGTDTASDLEESLGDDAGFPSINESWNPRDGPSCPQLLTGLGIFCGGGTFDRGLQEGGAVKFRYAVDWAEHALHSYRANLERPEEVDFFLGSVNDYLSKALSGQSTVAKPGSVQVISAGSPCQGFSRLQNSTDSEESKKNASMVASVVAFADLYCPHYMILENVVSMTECRNERKEHNVFSQILAALVGLGYQIQQFLIDSWSHGSSQQRSRLFIIATAPGLTPPPQPACSHAHPPNILTRSLGKSSNGLPFGTRDVNPDVALPHISPQEAVGDLPPVYDSQPQLCPAFPDHRTATTESDRSRMLMRAVPIRPRGMTLVQAWEQGMLSGEPLRYCETRGRIRQATTSKMYARVLPDKLFPTIVTKLAVGDGMNGRCMHWDQHRVLTVMEAKRAQGYLDHEVLVGIATQQMKIVGNSVDRSAALVLGLSLRKSWLKSHSNNEDEMEVDIVPGSAYGQNADIDTLQDEEVTRIDNAEVDNRTVKMSLTLSREDIEGVNKVTATTGRTFKELIRILSSREEHRTARQSIHGVSDGKNI